MIRSLLIAIAVCFYSSTFIDASVSLYESRFGARALGMGGAMMSLPQRSDSIFYNFTNPIRYNGMSIAASSSTIYELPVQTFSVENIPFLPFRFGAVYAADKQIQGAFINPDNRAQLTGTSLAYETYNLSTSYAISIFGINIGSKLSYIGQTAATANATSTLLSSGISSSIHIFDQHIHGSVIGHNVLSKSFQWSTGTSEKTPYYVTIGAGIQSSDFRWNIGIDALLPKVGQTRTNIGIEYWLAGNDYLKQGYAIRMGLMDKQFTMGLGIQFDSFSIDYANLFPEKVILKVNIMYQ